MKKKTVSIHGVESKISAEVGKVCALLNCTNWHVESKIYTIATKNCAQFSFNSKIIFDRNPQINRLTPQPTLVTNFDNIHISELEGKKLSHHFKKIMAYKNLFFCIF